MWGGKTGLELAPGASVTVSCVRVDIYNGRVSLNSTSSTTVEVFKIIEIMLLDFCGFTKRYINTPY